MKILVVSDTHKDFDSLYNLIRINKDIETIIHLGDGEDELSRIKDLFKDKEILSVRGNCDTNSTDPIVKINTFNNKKIFMTHGHIYKVKYNIYNAVMAAKQENADILLFGHTHCGFKDYYDGIYIMNPGSLGGINKSYGIIDIKDNKIFTNVIYINKKERG